MGQVPCPNSGRAAIFMGFIDICTASVERVTMRIGDSTIVTQASMASETAMDMPNGFSIYLPLDTFLGYLITKQMILDRQRLPAFLTCRPLGGVRPWPGAAPLGLALPFADSLIRHWQIVYTMPPLWAMPPAWPWNNAALGQVAPAYENPESAPDSE